jgi:hypothetical protein
MGLIHAPNTISSFKYTSRIYVSPQGSDSNDGRRPETALRTIKAAARLATTTTEVESIYVGTGEFIEDNPIYLPPGTAIIGDNLRRTILKPLNEGRDFFWWSSGCYVNYLVFQDNYFGGVGKLDTSNQFNDRVFPATGLSFNLFPGHTLQRLPGVYKDGAGLIAFQRNSIINSAYSYMISLNPGLVIPGGGEATCKRDIGYFVDAIANDLKAGGNVNSIKAGKAYRNSNGDLISTIAGEVVQTKQAFTKAKDLCKTAIMTVPDGYGIVDISNPGACTQVSDTIESLSNLIISLIDGGDTPQYNSGANYVLIDQEWIEVLDIQGNTITIADFGKRGINNPITGENTTSDKHINGAIVSQAGRAFRYAVAFPDQEGYWGKGRISINGSTVTGVNTNFTKEAFVGWTLKVGNASHTIQSINTNTSITLSNSVASISSKAYKVVPKKEQIFLSPYIQNCSNISVLGRAVYDSATQSYDASRTRAGGMLVDNLQLDNKTPIPSNVADAFTQIVFGGIGFHHKNDGYSQLVSVFQVFDSVGILCESGAYTSVTNSATNFGNEGLKAIGFSNNAIPSFKNGIATSIINQTKVGFNNSPTNILSSTFASESGGTKTKAIITVSNVDIGKFEAGQTITIAGHTSTPSINGVGLIISGLNFSANTIEVIYNTTFPNTRVNGAATGTITVTGGKLETKVTVSGFLENPLPNYIVKITGLAAHPSGTEYVVNNVYQPLENGICAFTLQQTIPTEVLSLLPPNRPLELRAPSTVNSSSHTYEYVGAGINYTALPINGGRTDKSKQAVEINSGKCYVSATDQDGNFNVGNYFNVDLRTGQITFAGQLNLGVIDALELLASPGVPIYEFVTSVRSQISAKNTAIATEKGVRDFVVANLGSLFLKEPTTSGGTGASAGQLVQLTSEGVIDSSMVRIPASSVYTVADQAARLVTSLNGIPLKAGDYVVQLNPAPATKYILTALPATTAGNWDVFSVDNFDASAIVSGLLSAARLGSGTANTNTFLSGGGTFAPVVQKLKPATDSPILVGTQNNTTPVSSGEAGFLEIDVTKAAYVSGQTSGSSSSGVAKFTYDDFNITSNVVSIKDKFKSATTPLNFNPSTGELTIQSASTTQTGALTLTDWTTFNNKEPAISAGTATQYWSGTKSWATLNTTNVTEGTNLYFTQSRVLTTPLTDLGSSPSAVITSTDTLIAALQKLQAQVTGKLSGVPIATTAVAGAVKVGSGLDVTGDGTVSIAATTNIQSGTTYTIQSSDNGKIVEFTAAVTVTLPNTLPAGFSCAIMQSGTGAVTIATIGGATLNNARLHTKLFGQWAMATLYVRSNNAGLNAAFWVLSGDTKA